MIVRQKKMEVKGSRSNVVEDFSFETRRARGKQRPLLDEAYKNNIKAFYVVGKAIIRGVEWGYDKVKDECIIRHD